VDVAGEVAGFGRLAERVRMEILPGELPEEC
jgi:hypothetical protein